MTQTLSASPSWIDDHCRRFSRATGWTMVFTDIDSEGGMSAIEAVQNSPECCWFSEISDDHRRIGLLHIELPRNSRLDRVFPAVRELADSFAQLVARCVSVGQMLDSRTRDLSTLVRINKTVPDGHLGQALQQLLQAAVTLSGFRAAALFLLDPATRQLHLRVAEQFDGRELATPIRRLADNPPDVRALGGEEVVLDRTSADAERWLPRKWSTGVCTAIESDAGPLGTLWVFDRRHRAPDERERHVLESVAAQIAGVLERVVLLRESADRERLQRDLNVASESQARDILGELPSGLPFDVGAACTSRYELGGDLCELIPVDRSRTIVAVGDASGDSVPAAMVMSAIRGALRTIAQRGADEAMRTDAVLQRLNSVLFRITPAHQFMSLLYGVLDAAENRITYSNAGHPTPILFRRGEPEATLDSHGMLLGVLPDSSYETSEVPLAAGDVLAFYSDGISEAMDRRRRMFRSEGIIGAVRRHVEKPAQQMVDAIWSELEAHLGDQMPDDRTLAIIKLPQ